MWILPLIGYAGAIVGFGFLTLAIASGLYYLSELVEEHTVIAKRLLTRTIYTIVGVQVVLCLVDGFPIWATLLGVVSHIVYLGNMRRFPFVKLSDPLFILSCVLVLVDHYVWFRHFSDTQTSSYQRASYYDDVEVPSFTMIASYFGLCVWLVPFALFVSLSAGDNVLPTMGTEPAHDGSGSSGYTGKANKPQGMIKAVVDWVRDTIGELVGARKKSRF
ncbi:Transmembrane adaptor Erv26 [Cordyceps militaris CM01]|uniref:Transmembrane adaptor Erv26 n=1 Tax=Cordyceps militaris (strain CM01) TaxID=983644 RepID=G3J6D1_CORMM|nr:Transmembrane adaptor Erv26 [Cordyceps militaris CM01]EGX96165.1 Transmembrane adaptor Erv26 [Cordyceps militaris CM01]